MDAYDNSSAGVSCEFRVTETVITTECLAISAVRDVLMVFRKVLRAVS